MKHLSNINRTDNCSNQFGIENGIRDLFLFSVTFSHAANNCKSLKYPREKICPTKYPRENLDSWITNENKFWTQEILTRNILDPRNTYEKKIWDPRCIQEKKFRTPKIPAKARWHDGIWPTKLSTLIKSSNFSPC